jgi:hypothetical protein
MSSENIYWLCVLNVDYVSNGTGFDYLRDFSSLRSVSQHVTYSKHDTRLLTGCNDFAAVSIRHLCGY